jgi:hypothetical protein
MTNTIVLVSSAIFILAIFTTATTTAFAFPYWSPFNQQQFFGNLWGNLCQNPYIATTNPNCGHVTQPPIVQPPIPPIVQPPIPPFVQPPIVQPPIPQPQQSTTSATSSTSQCYNDICTTTKCVNGACTTTGQPQPQPGQFASTETCINGVCTICTNGVCSTTSTAASANSNGNVLVNGNNH